MNYKYVSFVVVSLLALASAGADTRTVTRTDDHNDGVCDADCTLREAIAAALTNDTINFAASLNGAAIGLNGTELSIARNLTINGPSGGVTIDAGFLSRVFRVSAGTVTLSNLTITGGQVKGVRGADATPPYNNAQPGGDEYGGGVRNAGTLTLTNCRVTNNRVYGGNGGAGFVPNQNAVIFGREGGAGWGGGIANLGSLTLINCTVSGNYAFGGAGGITYDGDGVPGDRSGAGGLAYGGGIFSSQSGKTLIMTGCTLSGNVASGGPGANGAYWGYGGDGGAAFGGGLYSNAQTTTLKLCTMSDNGGEGGPGGGRGPYTYNVRNNEDGAGGSSYGGGIYTSSEFTLLSCTLSDNLARSGLDGGDRALSGSVQGGGLYGLGCTIRNTIIARNSIDGYHPSGPDVKGGQSSQGHNFIGNTGDTGDGSVSSGWMASDIKGVAASPLSPQLGPLQDNGGPTATMALSPGSGAIDAGDDTVLDSPLNLTTDQRGAGFPRKLGSHVDIGAFEAPAPTPTPVTTLANISTRLRVETGDNVLIGGFIVTGTQPKKVIVRAIGTSLPFADRLQNPTLELYGANGLIEANDNWVDSPNKQAIIDSTVPPASDLESAIVATLPANGNAYTAIVRGVNGGTGIGVVEAYDLDTAANSRLANISTRGLVQTGDNVLIAGTIVVGPSSQKVIIRGIGPSLSVPRKMADPTLELRDSNGALLQANDNWVDSPNKQAIIDSTVPPTNDLESAIVATLPGNNASYTAVLRGVNNSTGIAVVEVYALQ